MTIKQEIKKMIKKDKYYVTFVPRFDRVGDWHGRRLTARNDITDEFSYEDAEKIVKKLLERGEKAIKIKKL